MPRHCFGMNRWFASFAVAALAIGPSWPVQAGTATGAATEWTQLANNAQLVDLLKGSGLQVDNQLTQIGQLAEEIQNQLKIYQNMLQNTAQLPKQIWGQVEDDLNQLRAIVDRGQGIAFSMGNADEVLQQRFQSNSSLRTSLPGNAASVTTISASAAAARRPANELKRWASVSRRGGEPFRRCGLRRRLMSAREGRPVRAAATALPGR